MSEPKLPSVLAAASLLSGSIYLITNVANGKKYIGQTIKKPVRRWHVHCNAAGRDSKSHLHAAIRKYGVESFELSVLEVCTIEHLNERECYWIGHLETLHPLGYNLNSGGRQNTYVSDALRELHRRLSSGRKASEETKAKQSAAAKGFSDAARANSLATRTGKPLSVEHRANISAGIKAAHAHKAALRH